MRWNSNWILLAALAVVPFAQAEEPAPQAAAVQDAAFDRFADLSILDDAMKGGRADVVLDLALQLAEGERVLLRSHKAVSADELFAAALQLASETGDKDTLARLSKAAKGLNKTELAGKIAAAEKLGAASRSAAGPELSLPVESTSLEAFALFKATLNSVKAAKVAKDVDELQLIDAELEKSEIFDDAQKQTLKKVLSDAVASVPAEKAPSALAKLAGASRQAPGFYPGYYPGGFNPNTGGWQRPSYPVWNSPTQITGFNPITGGFNTGGTSVNNTAFDPWRNQSMNNGSARVVNRPVYDNFGNIRGWERGVEWTNSITGQTHGNTQIITPNGIGGGHHQQNVYRSVAPRP